MTKCEEIRSILRTNPTASNDQIAELFSERAEIGKQILRILERL